jgi:two-component system sensor histidine kinase UhpB
MRLRTRLHLVVTSLTVVFLIVLLGAEIRSTRARIREDIEAANQVATQLVSRLVDIYWSSGETPVVLEFLDALGHVRSSDIVLRHPGGPILYHSPPATYKAGEYAPAWFAHLLAPSVPRHTFLLPSGDQLVIRAETSRAILDGWDAVVRLLGIAAIMLVIANALAFWMIERALAPFPVIIAGLGRLQRGEFGYRLPLLPGVEAHAIVKAFNRMAQAVQDNVAAQRKAREAEARLEERQEMTQVLEQRLEEERRLIAHELHDEFGQSVTAIRSLAQAIVAGSSEPAIEDAARLISQEAARLYDAMHGLIPRLAPVSLDTMSLEGALESLAREMQRRHPSVTLSLHHELAIELGPSVTLTAYRVAQEGLINALRHAQAAHVEIDLRADATRLLVTVTDDGIGLTRERSRPGRFGLRGLRERVGHLGGQLSVDNREPRGVRLAAEIPLVPAPVTSP